MWIGDEHSVEAAFDTLFEPLGFDAGHGIEGKGDAVGMGMVG